ncbi:unnamed protein product [Symbiodinium sp. CCMP2592]|nr:unnamed protein product [Symbiodinium sp. CCMP2592]
MKKADMVEAIILKKRLDMCKQARAIVVQGVNKVNLRDLTLSLKMFEDAEVEVPLCFQLQVTQRMCTEGFHSLATSPEKARHNVSEYESLIKNMEIWRSSDSGFSLTSPSFGSLLATVLDQAALEDEENPEALIFDDVPAGKQSGQKGKPLEARKGGESCPAVAVAVLAAELVASYLSTWSCDAFFKMVRKGHAKNEGLVMLCTAFDAAVWEAEQDGSLKKLPKAVFKAVRCVHKCLCGLWVLIDPAADWPMQSLDSVIQLVKSKDAKVALESNLQIILSEHDLWIPAYQEFVRTAVATKEMLPSIRSAVAEITGAEEQDCLDQPFLEAVQLVLQGRTKLRSGTTGKLEEVLVPRLLKIVNKLCESDAQSTGRKMIETLDHFMALVSPDHDGVADSRRRLQEWSASKAAEMNKLSLIEYAVENSSEGGRASVSIAHVGDLLLRAQQSCLDIGEHGETGRDSLALGSLLRNVLLHLSDQMAAVPTGGAMITGQCFNIAQDLIQKILKSQTFTRQTLIKFLKILRDGQQHLQQTRSFLAGGKDAAARVEADPDHEKLLGLVQSHRNITTFATKLSDVRVNVPDANDADLPCTQMIPVPSIGQLPPDVTDVLSYVLAETANNAVSLVSAIQADAYDLHMPATSWKKALTDASSLDEVYRTARANLASVKGLVVQKHVTEADQVLDKADELSSVVTSLVDEDEDKDAVLSHWTRFNQEVRTLKEHTNAARVMKTEAVLWHNMCNVRVKDSAKKVVSAELASIANGKPHHDLILKQLFEEAKKFG